MDTICDKIWAFLIQQNPQFAIYKGADDNSTTLLDSFNVEKIIEQQTFWEKLQVELSEVDQSSLSYDDKITNLIVEYYIQVILEGNHYESYLMPVNYFSHPISNFIVFTLPRLEYNTVEDFSRYFKLIQNLPNQLNDAKEALKIGVKKNIVLHQVSLGPSFFKRLEDMISLDIQQNELFGPLLSTKSHIDSEKWKELQTEGRNIIEKQLIPSIESFRNFLIEEYIPHHRSGLSINTLPCPENVPSRYDVLFKFHCDVDLSPRECHVIGQKEVDRLQKRIQLIMNKLEFEGSMREFADFIHDKAEYTFKDEDELITYCEDYYRSAMPKVKSLFKKTSHLKLAFVKSPGKSPAKAIYLPASRGNSHPATLLVTIAQTPNMRKYEIPSLMLHETEPGHHLQACYALSNTGLPKFRTNKEDMYYHLAPGRIPLNTAYTEGWGLYCEELGEELGLYDEDFYIQ